MAEVQDMPQTTAKHLKKMPLPMKIGGFLIRNFSATGEDPKRMRLISIAISHYVEKVRWVLDMLCIIKGDENLYTEDGHLPGMHMFFSTPASDGAASMTPMLVTRKEGEDACLWDSTKIMMWLAKENPELAFLYPEDKKEEVVALEDTFDQELAVPIRRFAYSIILKYPDVAKRIITPELTWFERCIMPGVYPVLKGKLARLLDIDFKEGSTTTVDAQREILAVFDKVEELRKDGREYLVGSHFTAADLTLAATAYPIACYLVPELFATRISPLATMPLEYQEAMKPILEHPTAEFLAKIYRYHRFSTCPPTAEAASPEKEVSIHWNKTASYMPRALVGSIFVGVSALILYQAWK